MSPNDDAAEFAGFRRSLERLDGLSYRASQLGQLIPDGAQLLGDDAALQGYSQAATCAALLNSATEHLCLIRTETAWRDGALIFTFPSLVRIGIELAATVVWLLGDDEPETRWIRRLRLETAFLDTFNLSVEDRADGEARNTALNNARSGRRDIHRVARENGFQVEKMKQIGVKPSAILEYSSAELVKSTPRLDPERPLYFREVWAIASGFVHGQDWAHQMYAKQIRSPNGDTPQGTPGITVSFSDLTPMVEAAITMLSFAFDIWDRRRLPR